SAGGDKWSRPSMISARDSGATMRSSTGGCPSRGEHGPDIREDRSTRGDTLRSRRNRARMQIDIVGRSVSCALVVDSIAALRSRRVLRLVPALTIGAAFSTGTTSAAASAEEPIRVEYTAPPECPARERLLATVASYTGEFRQAQPGEEARVV